jgi:dipeptidyl aminopeptidase/acylaminoacyl peptidase
MLDTMGCDVATCDATGGQMVGEMATSYMNTPLADDPARWAAASPVHNVDPSDPPMMLVHSTSDPLVPVDQVGVMQDALVANGIDVTTMLVPGTAHAPDLDLEAWNATVQFLRDHV